MENDLVGVLISLIPEGIENAIHQEEIAAQMNINCGMVKSLVKKARISGAAILSGKRGYWISADDYEKQAFVKMMRKHALSRLKSSKEIRRSLINNANDGQINFLDKLVSKEIENRGEHNNG